MENKDDKLHAPIYDAHNFVVAGVEDDEEFVIILEMNTQLLQRVMYSLNSDCKPKTRRVFYCQN